MPMARHAASRHGKESGDGYQNNKFDEVDWQINNQTCAVLQSLAEASTVLEGKKYGKQRKPRVQSVSYPVLPERNRNGILRIPPGTGIARRHPEPEPESHF